MSDPRYKNLPSVTIIIPAYNEEQYIEATLRSLHDLDYPKELLKTIVVDNNSEDQTAQIAKGLADEVLQLTVGNVGAVRNFGARTARSDVLVFIDGDCIVDKNWLNQGVSLLQESEKAVYGGPCKTRSNANWVEKLWLLENPCHARIQPDLLGSCIFIRASSFYAINGFDESMTSGEDSDLSARLRKAGYKVVISPVIPVIHLGNPSTIKHFISRQIWHSENYIPFIGNSIRDYTFWITIAFISGAFLTLISAISRTPAMFNLGVLLLVTFPALLSVKRIVLTKYRPQSIKDLLGIYILDFLYLTGRSIGLLKSAFKALQRAKNRFSKLERGQSP